MVIIECDRSSSSSSFIAKILIRKKIRPVRYIIIWNLWQQQQQQQQQYGGLNIFSSSPSTSLSSIFLSILLLPLRGQKTLSPLSQSHAYNLNPW